MNCTSHKNRMNTSCSPKQRPYVMVQGLWYRSISDRIYTQPQRTLLLRNSAACWAWSAAFPVSAVTKNGWRMWDFNRFLRLIDIDYLFLTWHNNPHGVRTRRQLLTAGAFTHITLHWRRTFGDVPLAPVTTENTSCEGSGNMGVIIKSDGVIESLMSEISMNKTSFFFLVQ